MLSSLSQIQVMSITAVFLALSLTMIALYIHRTLKQNRIMSRRLVGIPAQTSGTVRGKINKKPFLATPKMIATFGQHLTLPGPEEITRMRFLLSQAGYYTTKSIPVFYAIRVVSLILPVSLLLGYWAFFAPNMPSRTLIPLAVFMIITGLFAPLFVLRTKINRRKNQAREGFPDMMDLLLACIEAGMGLDMALSNVAKELGKRYPVIQINLDLLNLELMAGRTRPEAFKNFAERLGLAEAGALNIMLKQSEEMGSSLGAALRTFSDEMRNKRMMKAEEKAMALPAKMTVPLILFIFPTIMVLLFLPAGIRIASGIM